MTTHRVVLRELELILPRVWTLDREHSAVSLLFSATQWMRHNNAMNQLVTRESGSACVIRCAIYFCMAQSSISTRGRKVSANKGQINMIENRSNNRLILQYFLMKQEGPRVLNEVETLKLSSVECGPETPKQKKQGGQIFGLLWSEGSVSSCFWTTQATMWVDPPRAKQ